MKWTLALVVFLVACTTTVKGEGPGGSTSSSTSTSSGGTSSGGTSGTSTSGGASTSSSGSGGACSDSFDCNGIPYCPCPNGARDGIGRWECAGTCYVDCSDPSCLSQ